MNQSPSYKTNDPRGWCGDPKRGAALGRPTIHEAPKDFDGKLTLRRIHLDSDGCDSNGTYFGIGAPLYWYAYSGEDSVEIDGMVRAASREEAKQKILKDYPKARFYR